MLRLRRAIINSRIGSGIRISGQNVLDRVFLNYLSPESLSLGHFRTVCDHRNFSQLVLTFLYFEWRPPERDLPSGDRDARER